MKEIEVKVVVDSSKAAQDLKKVDKGVKDIGKSADDTGKKVGDVGKAAKGTKKGFKFMKIGIMSVGAAFKAAGIGLLLGIVAGLTDAFSRNKKIMDAVGLVLGTVQQVFSQVTDAIIDTYDSITQTSGSFDALKKVVLGLMTIAFTPLKLVFYQLKTQLLGLNLIYQKLFGDDASVKQAVADLEEVKNEIIQVGKDAVQAGKDVVNGAGEAVDELVNMATIAGNNLSKVSLEVATNQAKANQTAIDGALAIIALSSKQTAEYETQAEKLRQIRDDDGRSIADRQKANEDLTKTLDLQEAAMKRGADAALVAARAENQKNDSAETRAAIIDAEAAQAQVLADIEGKRSEQEANRVALLKEEKDLTTTISDSEAERRKKQLEFEAEQENDPLKKLEKQKKALEDERLAIEEDIENKRDLYAEGTQARIDAEQDYLNRTQEVDNAITANKKAQGEVQVANDKTANEEKIKNEKAVAQAQKDVRANGLSSIKSGLQSIAALAEGNKEIQAATLIAGNLISAAEVIQSTAIANSKAVATFPTTAGQPWVAINTASAGLSIAASMSATNKALGALGKGSASGGDSSASQGQGASAPSFNLVEGSADNQIAQGLQRGDNPIRAYVVSQDVTTQQSLERKIVTSNSFG
tara:strand:+ start:7954 stop:9873 length:1920 start_codon:yes stop_codon:yes gene_type:complete